MTLGAPMCCNSFLAALCFSTNVSLKGSVVRNSTGRRLCTRRVCTSRCSYATCWLFEALASPEEALAQDRIAAAKPAIICLHTKQGRVSLGQGDIRRTPRQASAAPRQTSKRLTIRLSSGREIMLRCQQIVAAIFSLLLNNVMNCGRSVASASH